MQLFPVYNVTGTFSERFVQCVFPAVLIITRTDYVLKKIFPRQLVFACFDQWFDKNWSKFMLFVT